MPLDPSPEEHDAIKSEARRRAMVERRRLVREEPAPVATRGRRGDDEEAREDGEREERDIRVVRRDREGRESRAGSGSPRWTRGRPPLQAEFNDLGRGSLFVGIESAAIALDTAA